MADRPLTIVHTDFHRGWGGQINQVLTSCFGLRERGHRVILAVPAGGLPAQRARAGGLELFDAVQFRAAGNVGALLGDIRALARLMREAKPDLIHSHGSQDTWAVAVANRYWFGAPRLPHLLTRHNTKRVRNSAANRHLIGTLLDRLIVVAPEILDRYRPFIEAGLLDPTRVPVIPSPLRPDVRDANPDRATLRRELRLSADVKLCGTLARLVPDKGQTDLLAAASSVIEAGHDLHVVLAGDGSDESRLRQQVAETPSLANRVHFLGFRRDVADVTASLDIAVLPSVDCDASSGMIKEALALGVPVIATDVGAAREMLGDGRFGAIVPIADPAALAAALRQLLHDLPAAREAAARGGEQIRATYTVDRLVSGLEQVYRDLLQQRR